MTIQEINKKKDWEDFVLEKDVTFLQSWNWGEFNQSLGNKIFRLGIRDGDELVGVALIIKIQAKRGRFLFVPQGPIITNTSNQLVVMELFVDYLKKLAKKENCSFARVSSSLIRNKENEKLFKSLGFRGAPIHTHAEYMWLLDLSPSEDKLLRNMRKTTRYCVRRADKDGVEIIKSRDLKDVQIFNNLYKETASRHNFVPFSEDYLKKEFNAFVSDNQLLVFLAKHNERVVSGAIIVFYGGTAFFHQGASSSHSQANASYLLQWEIIREAKRRGCRFYNFWGIVKDEQKSHPWAGLTLFKKGFGGFDKEYLPTQDLVLGLAYWFNFLVEKARKLKRNL